MRPLCAPTLRSLVRPCPGDPPSRDRLQRRKRSGAAPGIPSQKPRGAPEVAAAASLRRWVEGGPGRQESPCSAARSPPPGPLLSGLRPGRARRGLFRAAAALGIPGRPSRKPRRAKRSARGRPLWAAVLPALRRRWAPAPAGVFAVGEALRPAQPAAEAPRCRLAGPDDEMASEGLPGEKSPLTVKGGSALPFPSRAQSCPPSARGGREGRLVSGPAKVRRQQQIWAARVSAFLLPRL